MSTKPAGDGEPSDLKSFIDAQINKDFFCAFGASGQHKDRIVHELKEIRKQQKQIFRDGFTSEITLENYTRDTERENQESEFFRGYAEEFKSRTQAVNDRVKSGMTKNAAKVADMYLDMQIQLDDTKKGRY
jgi:hypothetical protein|tara:strand:- start:97 stop:489 length:393 start_codon:yes stop_codon:yes gene_type:complete